MIASLSGLYKIREIKRKRVEKEKKKSRKREEKEQKKRRKFFGRPWSKVKSQGKCELENMKAEKREKKN